MYIIGNSKPCRAVWKNEKRKKGKNTTRTEVIMKNSVIWEIFKSGFRFCVLKYYCKEQSVYTVAVQDRQKPFAGATCVCSYISVEYLLIIYYNDFVY